MNTEPRSDTTMGANTVAASDSQHHWHPFTSMRTFRPEHMMMQRARDCWVWDAEGREYLDAFAGLWSVNAGHNHPRIVEAIIAQVTEMCAAPLFGRSHPTAAVLSARLAQICPGTLDRVFFSVQGSHAVETALKMSRQFWRAAGRGGKFKIISRERAYHGTAFGGTTAQGIAANRAPFEPLVPGFSHISAPCKFPCDLDCAAELEREILLQGPETVAAFIAEPVVGTGGVIPAPDGYMNKVADICRTYDVLFIVDEVMTGFGRTGPMLAIEHSGVEPDIVILSKGLTSGHLPMAATVTTGGVYSTILDGAARSGVEFPTGATFDGYPAGCAAALANLDVFQEENLLQRSESSGRYLQGSLSELAASKRVGQVRGVGMVAGIELVEPIADKICAEAFARGVIVRPLAGNHVIAVAPPLTIGHDSIDRAVTVLRDSIVAVR